MASWRARCGRRTLSSQRHLAGLPVPCSPASGRTEGVRWLKLSRSVCRLVKCCKGTGGTSVVSAQGEEPGGQERCKSHAAGTRAACLDD